MLSHEWASVLLVTAMGFLLRSFFRLKNRYVGIDSWCHLLAAKRIRENHYSLPKSLNIFISEEDGDYDYPPLYHYLLAILPERYFMFVGRFISAAVDSIHSMLVFFLILFLTKSFEWGLVAQTVYVLSPRIVFETFSSGPRVPGSLLVTLFFMSFYFSANKPLFGVLCIILVSLVCLTHRMSVQALFLLSGSFLLVSFSFYPMLAFIGAGFGLAVVLSRFHYLVVLQGHIIKVNFFRKHLKEMLNYEDPFYEDASVHAYMSGKNKGLHTYFYMAKLFLLENPWNLFSVVFLLFLLHSIFSGDYGITLDFIFWFLWATMTVAYALVTSCFEQLRPIGPGWKYLNFGVFPTSIVTIVVLRSLDNLVGAALFISCVILSLYYIASEMKKAQEGVDYRTIVLDKDDMRCLDFIKRNSVKKVLCIPLTYSYPVAYLCETKVLWQEKESKLDRRLWSGQVVIGSLEDIVNEYDIEMILIHKKFEPFYNLSFSDNVFSSGVLSVYNTRVVYQTRELEA